MLLTVFLLPSLIPFSGTWAEEVGRDTEILDYTAPNQLYVHPNETISTYVTVHNKAEENQAFTIQPLSIPEPLSTVGLPVTELLVPNHLKQIAFGVRAPVGATYQNLTVSFSITSDLDSELNETVSMEVAIVPRSNLTFGVDDFTAFTVDELVRTAVAVNISNNASFTDDVTFSIGTSSSWNWGWNMPNTNGNEAYITMAPNTLSYVYLWIDVPAVVNGAPLAGTGPRFTLSATSGLDISVSTWSFDLLMNNKKNASIDHLESSLEVAPNQDGRLSAVVRNVGNTPNTLNITLQALTVEGSPVPGSNPSDRFNSSGWVVALFGGLEDIVLQPNESRTIEIGFQAPNEFQGEIHVELQVFANGAKSNARTANAVARINRISSGTLSAEETGCQSVQPNQSCTVNLGALNTGNSVNTYVLREVSTTGGFAVELPQEGLFVLPNQLKSFSVATITAPSDGMAFQTGSTTVELLDDTGAVVDDFEIQMRVAPKIEWTFRNVEEQVNAKGILSIAMEVRNDGNAVDGLIVQLQSSHFVDMGFIPPDIAIYEDGVEYPRSFEVNDIPLNSNFTIRAWVQLPQDQPTNGTVYINTTIRSRLAPEVPFVHTSTGDYLGVAWQPSEADEEGIDWSGMASTVVLYVEAWWGVVFSVFLASAILYKAVIDRQRRLEENEILPYQQTSNQSDDWMLRYQTETPATEPEVQAGPAQEVPKAAYEAMFRHQHGMAEPTSASVDNTLVAAATVVLDRRTEEASKSKADALLENIQSQGVATPFVADSALVQSPAEPVLPAKSQASKSEAIDDLEF
jgi:hypothetical protein